MAIMKMENTLDHKVDDTCVSHKLLYLKLMITILRIIDKAKVHLETVASERSLYWNACKSSRDSLKTMFTAAADVFQPPPPSYFYPLRVTR